MLIRSPRNDARPDAVVLARLAESLGLVGVWLQDGVCDPLNVARATQTVRIGLVAEAGNPPADLARRLAELDVASGGRAALAGRSGLDEVVTLLVEETVDPPAVQDPHPGLWLAGEGAGCVARASRAGLGALVLGGLDHSDVAAAVRDHAAVLASDRWSATGYCVVERVAVCRRLDRLDVAADAAAALDELVLVLDSGTVEDERALRTFAAAGADAAGRPRVPVDPAALEAGIARRLGGAPTVARRRPGLRRRLVGRGETAFRAWVVGEGENPRRLDRVVGSTPVLAGLFAALAARFVPARAEGFVGELCFVVRRPGGDRPWTLELGPDRARARRGRSAEAALTLTLAAADLARLAAGTLDPATALMTGRLELEGDFALAVRFGELFGLPPVM